jgi:tricorn protease
VCCWTISCLDSAGRFRGDSDLGDLLASGVQTGLLGADFEVADNRYRFARVYNGENWNPQLRAPP